MELDQKTGAGDLVKVKCKNCGENIHHHDWCSLENCLRALSAPEAEQETDILSRLAALPDPTGAIQEAQIIISEFRRDVAEAEQVVPERWWEYHHQACGTAFRGCHPTLCPKDQYEKTGVWKTYEQLRVEQDERKVEPEAEQETRNIAVARQEIYAEKEAEQEWEEWEIDGYAGYGLPKSIKMRRVKP